MRQLLIIGSFALAAVLSACTGEHIPFVYKIDILQGNIVDQGMIDQLERGMDKARVRYVMGSPMLVDVFHEDRWDYIYLRSPGRGKPERRRITLHFENDRLARIDGDVQVAGGAAAGGGTRRVTNVEVPLEQDKGLLEGLMDRMGMGDDDKGSEPAPETEPGRAKESAE